MNRFHIITTGLNFFATEVPPALGKSVQEEEDTVQLVGNENRQENPFQQRYEEEPSDLVVVPAASVSGENA